MKLVKSLTITFEMLTAAVMDQVPILYCGAVGSGFGSLKVLEAIPLPLVTPCRTKIIVFFKFNSFNNLIYHIISSDICR